ncbi:MAG: hypothetical protein ACQESL_09030, partial [Bacteroidota bacterium]
FKKNIARRLNYKHGFYHQVKRNLFAAKAAVRIIRVKNSLSTIHFLTSVLNKNYPGIHRRPG